MSEAPERIWVTEIPSIMRMGACHVHKLTGATEYVRADIADALLEAVKAMRDDPTIKAVCASPLWAQMVNAIEKAEGKA